MWAKLIEQRLLRLATNSEESFWSAAVEWAGWGLPDVIGAYDIFHLYGSIRKIEKKGDPRNLFEIDGRVIVMSEETLGWSENKLDAEEIWSKPLHVFAEYSDDEFIPYTGKRAEEWNLEHCEFDNDVLDGVLIVDDEIFQLCTVSEKTEEQLAILRYFLLEHPLSHVLRQAEGNEKTKIVSQLALTPEKTRLLRAFLVDDNLATSILYFLAYYARIVRNKEHDRLESVIYDFNREVKEKELCREIDKLDIQIFLSLLEEEIWLTDAYLVQDNDEWEAPEPRWHSLLACVSDMIFLNQRVFNRNVLLGKIPITREFCWVIPAERRQALIKSFQKSSDHEAKKRLISIFNFGEELLTVKERDSICKTIFKDGVYPIFEELAQSSPDSYLRRYAAENHGFRLIVDARSHTNEE